MKKLMALLLAAVMVLGCAGVFAEEASKTLTIKENKDGAFNVSFQMPEGATLVYEDVVDNLYSASISMKDGLGMYLSVSRDMVVADLDEETGLTTFNEENGYTDEYLKAMMTEYYADVYDDIETGVKTTAYGTKLAVARLNDPEAPFAYIITYWKGYEIGMTLINTDEKYNFYPITDEQINLAVDFLSELWMTVEK